MSLMLSFLVTEYGYKSLLLADGNGITALKQDTVLKMNSQAKHYLNRQTGKLSPALK